MIRPALKGAPVPRARQSYLFEHVEATPYYPVSSGFHVDASADRSIPAGGILLPPEPDPEEAPDPCDPDSLESDPGTWPAWTDAHRYATTRGGGR